MGAPSPPGAPERGWRGQVRGEAGEGGSQGDGAALQGGGPQTGTGRGLRGQVEGGLARAQWALAPWRGTGCRRYELPPGRLGQEDSPLLGLGGLIPVSSRWEEGKFRV